MTEKIAVIGLGYVGLPLALALAEKFPGTIGFDIDHHKIASIIAGIDPTGEGFDDCLLNTSLEVTSSPERLENVTFFIVGVPTPVDSRNQPNLAPIVGACNVVGSYLKHNDVVVFESTVYPGLTEEVCGPLLSQLSGLTPSIDFFLGYSPERINPGDVKHTLQNIVKIVAGDTKDTLARVASVYEQIVKAGIYCAPSIKVAEAAKVIENTQRDLNIALMNELAIVFDRLGISTREVIEAAKTKWNFLPFTPGLVGGHCIGVDPYYLTAKALELGYHPQVILAGRRINDDMGIFIAQRVVKLLGKSGLDFKKARIGVLGITFKENVRDARNSRVPDLIKELEEYGTSVLVHDPIASSEQCYSEYGVNLVQREELQNLDCLVVAVCHKPFLAMPNSELKHMVKEGGVIVDVKSCLDPSAVRQDFVYWSL
jgi:UDP-N-acetyl-D-galactosamine dehydrogenase